MIEVEGLDKEEIRENIPSAQCSKCGAKNHITKNCTIGKRCYIPGCGSKTHSSVEHPGQFPVKDQKKDNAPP